MKPILKGILLAVILVVIAYAINTRHDKKVLAQAKTQPEVAKYLVEVPKLQPGDYVTIFGKSTPETYMVSDATVGSADVVLTGVGYIQGKTILLGKDIDSALASQKNGRAMKFVRQQADENYWKMFKTEITPPLHR